MSDAEREVVRLQNIILDARKALDDGRMGDLRRLLVTGKETRLVAVTSVIAKDGPR